MRLPPAYTARYFGPDGRMPAVTPPGLRPGTGGRVLVYRRDLEEQVRATGIEDPASVLASERVTGWLEGGRTRHARIDAGDDEWVLKAYRRGGVVGSLNADRYWGTGRFLRELEVASAASSMGVSTPDVVAIVVEDAGCGAVRAWLVSRYLAGVRPLHEWFGSPEEIAMFARAGELVARMHRAGIDHPDLHLGNIVGRVDGGSVRAFVIDWDRAQRRPVGSWNPFSNLNRLWRSVRKGFLQGRLQSAPSPDTGGGSSRGGAALHAFVRGYFRRQPRLLMQARRYLRHRAILLELRTLFWRSPQ